MLLSQKALPHTATAATTMDQAHTAPAAAAAAAGRGAAGGTARGAPRRTAATASSGVRFVAVPGSGMENIFQAQKTQTQSKRKVGLNANAKLSFGEDMMSQSQDGDGVEQAGGGGGCWRGGSGCSVDDGTKGGVRARTAATQAPELKPSDWAKLARNNSNRYDTYLVRRASISCLVLFLCTVLERRNNARRTWYVLVSQGTKQPTESFSGSPFAMRVVPQAVLFVSCRSIGHL